MLKVENGSILIFKNKKEKPNYPDYKGQGMFNGEIIEVSLWVKEGKNGKFFSGKLSPEYNPEERLKNNQSDAEVTENPTDDLPF